MQIIFPKNRQPESSKPHLLSFTTEDSRAMQLGIEVQQHLSDILPSAGIGSWMMRTSDGMISGCRQVSSFLGRPAESISFRAILAQVVEKSKMPLIDAIRGAFSGKSFSLEIAVIAGIQNEIRWARVSGKTVHFSLGRKGLMGIIEDITEDKNRIQMKNDMIAYLNHELRSPLSTLRLYLQTAVKIQTENIGLADRFFKKADEQISNMLSLTENYLGLTAIEEGHLKLNKSIFDIGQLLKNLAANYRSQYEAFNFIILINQVYLVYADRLKIAQVMENLLSNAVKYSPSGRTIIVECHLQGTKVMISVCDQGQGIRAKDLKQLFSRYFRAGEVGSNGHGIGLNLVKRIIDAHKEAITLTSLTGKGSQFYLTLPLAEPSAAPVSN